MAPVGHELRDGGGLQQRQHRAGLAMVRWAHGVEQVGRRADPAAECRAHLAVRRVRVPDRHDDTRRGELLDRGEAPRQLRREGDHAHGSPARGEQPGHVAGLGGPQHRRVVRARAARAEPGPLEVDAGEHAAFDQRRERRHLGLETRKRSAHQAGHGRRRPGPAVEGHRLRGRLRSVLVREPAAPVLVDVDQAGQQDQPLGVDPGRPARHLHGAAAHGRDPVTDDLHPDVVGVGVGGDQPAPGQEEVTGRGGCRRHRPVQPRSREISAAVSRNAGR
jgi:hypothetical protein